MNYDQKVTKVSCDNPDRLEYARIKFRINFVQNFSTQKSFANTVNPLDNVPGVYLIIEILESFYWQRFLKEEALKKFRKCKKLISIMKFRNCV